MTLIKSDKILQPKVEATFYKIADEYFPTLSADITSDYTDKYTRTLTAHLGTDNLVIPIEISLNYYQSMLDKNKSDIPAGLFTLPKRVADFKPDDLLEYMVAQDIFTDIYYFKLTDILTDDYFQSLLNSKLRLDQNNMLIYNTLSDIKADLDFIKNSGYDLALNQQKKQNKLVANFKSDNNPINVYLANMFADWCRQQYLDGNDLYLYPERNALSYNVVHEFVQDWLYSRFNYLNNTATVNTEDIQSRILQATGNIEVEDKKNKQ